jgi:hypothetical protein
MTGINQLINDLEQLVDSGSERVADLFRQLRESAKDAERYRALRFCGEEFNRYVVIDVTDARAGTRTYSGDRLDVVADQLIQDQRAMTAKGAAT